MNTGQMRTRDFLHILPDLVRQQLPPELNEFHVVGPTMSLVKLHFGDPRIHYEVWVQKRMREIELGLHFEGDPGVNSSYLELLSHHSDAIRSALGQGVETEQWVKSWTRVHEILPLEPLTDDFLIELSFKLSRMMSILEPLLRVS